MNSTVGEGHIDQNIEKKKKKNTKKTPNKLKRKLVPTLQFFLISNFNCDTFEAIMALLFFFVVKRIFIYLLFNIIKQT